jgi:hypothetical protein
MNEMVSKIVGLPNLAFDQVRREVRRVGKVFHRQVIESIGDITGLGLDSDKSLWL